MKNTLVILFLAQILTLFAKESEPFRPNFEIISDIFDAKIPKGKYSVEGTIYDYNTNEILDNVTISAGKNVIKNKLNGTFKISNKVSNNILKFVKKNYSDTYLEDYKLLNQHRIKLKIYLIKEYEKIQYNVKKPVIYSYSDKDLYFKFQLKTKGDLVFMYPKMNEKTFTKNGVSEKTFTWRMQLKNNKLIDTNNIEIPYLFWESRQESINFKRDKNNILFGNLVHKKDVAFFLDSSLTAIGFNSIEKADFITFWGPQMIKNDFYFIQFLENEECEQFANYEIDPMPNYLNRIYMLFSGFETKSSIFEYEKQQVKQLNRKGFYFVDWGGIELGIQKIIHEN